MVRALYGNNTDLMERESMGQITADADSVFNETLIDSWMQLKELDSDPNFFFMAVDPSGGGASLMGIVSLVLVGTECFIMGLDAMKVKGPEDMKTLLISHLRAVRSHPRLRNAWCIFIPESNLGMEAAHMAHMLQNERLVYTLKEKNRVGVATTNKRKILYVQACLEYQSGMHISPKCVCVNPQLDANERLLLTKKEFRTQLLKFKKLVVGTVNAFDLPKIIFTGKTSSGNQDDLVLTLLFGVFWAREFLGKKIPNVPYEMFKEIN